MKKIMPTKLAMIAAALAVLALSPVFAQTVPADLAGKTFYYKYQFSVDQETEARRIASGVPNIYITFTRNGCYVSDSNGMQSSGRDVFTYLGEQNDMHIFRFRTTFNDGTTNDSYEYFSKDYRRLNRAYNILSWGNSPYDILVWEQSAPPAPQTGSTGPDRMW